MDVASLAIQIKTGDVQKGVKELDKLTESGRKAERATDQLSSAFGGLSGVLRTVGIGLSAVQIIGYVDQYTKFTAQLRLATNSATEFSNAISEVRRISNESQASLAETGVLYARIANGTRELGISQKQLAEITETVNLSLKVSGAGAQESASAMLQLSQAFASGVLRGEEFNAVNEAAPRLMKALADGLGVPVGALREMAQQGQITSEVLASVLPKALGGLREEAKNVQTISGAFQVLQNNVMEFVGESANANGSAKLLANSIVAIGESINMLSSAAIGFGAAKLSKVLYESGSAAISFIASSRAATLATLEAAKATTASTSATVASTAARVAELRQMVLNAEGAVAVAVATNGLIPAQARAAAAVEAHAIATANLATAQRAASISTGLISGAIGALGGPIGAITTALGLGVTAWLLWGDSASKSETKATDIVEKSTQEIVSDLDRQIQKLKERNQLAGEGGVAGLKNQESEAVQRLARIQDQIRKASQGVGEFSNLSDAGRADVLAKLTKQYGELYGRIQSVDQQQKLLASGSTEDLIKAKMRLAGIDKSYLDDLKTYQEALKKGQITEKEYVQAVSELAKETYKKSSAGEAQKRSIEERKQQEKEFNDERIRMQRERILEENDLRWKQIDDEKREEERLNQERIRMQRQRIIDESDARFKAIEEEEKEQKRLTEEIRRDLTSALARAFESGKNPAAAFAQAVASTVFSKLSAAVADALITGFMQKTGINANSGNDLFGSILNIGSSFFGGNSGFGSGSAYGNMDLGMNFEGGGFTGSGSRSGGMDGKGGFMAMLHPNETVIDHTKGGGMGQIVYAPVISIDSRTDRGEVMRLVQSAVQNGNNQLVDRLQRQGRI